MHFLGKFKLLWFLSLCLLTQARNLHRREVESLKVADIHFKMPQKYIIEPIKTLSDDSVAPPYDAVDFGFEDKLNEIKSNNEKSNNEIAMKTSTQTDEELKTEKNLDAENFNKTRDDENLEILVTSEISSENNANTKNEAHQNEFFKVEIYMDSENVENNLKYLETSPITKFEDGLKTSTESIDTNDKETKAMNSDKNIATETDKEMENVNTERISVTKVEAIKSDEILVTKIEKNDKETMNSENIVPIKVNNLKNSEKETVDSEITSTDIFKHTKNETKNSKIIISTDQTNLKDKEEDKVEETILTEKLTPIKAENTEDKANVLIPIKEIIVNDKEQISEKITSTKVLNLNGKEKVTTTEENNLKDKLKAPENSENIIETNDLESSATGATTTTFDHEKTTDNINLDKNTHLEEIPVIVSDKLKSSGNLGNENVLEISETTEKTTTETISIEASRNSNKESVKQPNIQVTSKTTVTDLKEAENKQTGLQRLQKTFATLLSNQTTSTITKKLAKNLNIAPQYMALVNKESSSSYPTSTTTIKQVTENPFASTTKPFSFITLTPTRPSRLSTTRPTASEHTPTTTRRPIINPGWFFNFPILPSGPSTTNKTQSTLGFGIFAVPLNWIPNFGNFFDPISIIETRPPLNHAPTPPAQSRELAFWNAGANKQTNAKVNKTQSTDGKPSYWKPWTYITGLQFPKFPKFNYSKNALTEQATIPANTGVMHLYFLIKNPFQGQTIQSPGKNLNAEIITTTVTDKIDTVAKDQKSAIDGVDSVKAVVKESASEIVKETATELVNLSPKIDSNNIEGVSKVESNQKAWFILELPKPMVNFVNSIMDTFRPQQN